MSSIPNSKTGTCSRCGDENVSCRKRGKDLLCISKCCRSDDTKKQIDKANQKNKVRGLVTRDSQEIGSVQSLVNDLDAVYSKYIRLKYADANGIVTCWVCEKPYLWKNIDCGHYISRGNKRTRFMEENTYPQCKFCNSIHNDNTKPFKEAIEKHFKGITGYLEEITLDRSVYKYDLSELKQSLVNYTNKLKIVESKLTIN